MSSSPMSAPLGLYSLREEEQRLRLRKRQQIESHWRSPIDQVLPKAIRPRLTPSKVKARIGQQAPEAEWWRWSTDLFYKLENLASMTPGRLAFAQALMQAEVSRRHQDYTNNRKEDAELLKSDLIRIIAELRERATMGADDSDEESEGSDVDNAFDQDEEAAAHDGVDDDTDDTKDVQGPSRLNKSIKDQSAGIEVDIEQPVKTEPDDEKAIKRKTDNEDLPAPKRHAAASLSSQPQAPSKDILEKKANIASLRAAAARLKHQAALREAKAFKLEAEVFEEEAGEVD